jgi:hypothetical protein
MKKRLFDVLRRVFKWRLKFYRTTVNLFRHPTGHAVCLVAELSVSDLYDEVLKQVHCCPVKIQETEKSLLAGLF